MRRERAGGHGRSCSCTVTLLNGGCRRGLISAVWRVSEDGLGGEIARIRRRVSGEVGTSKDGLGKQGGHFPGTESQQVKLAWLGVTLSMRWYYRV